MQDSGFLDVPNARLYYEVAGAGPAVVFVHGFTLDTRMWDDQWTVFGERYRVVRYDLRGFGRSEAEPVPYSDLDDLLALLNCLDIERAHLVGLSMGGMVLVHFALTHPRRVRGFQDLLREGGDTRGVDGDRRTDCAPVQRELHAPGEGLPPRATPGSQWP